VNERLGQKRQNNAPLQIPQSSATSTIALGRITILASGFTTTTTITTTLTTTISKAVQFEDTGEA